MSDIEKQPIQDFANAVNLIRETRSRVFSYANKQLVSLYWEFGRFVSLKVSEENWGKGVVKQLADYIQKEEPGAKGFSERNIWRMKQFYETYRDNEKLSTLWSELSWSHNRLIMSRCKTPEEQEFYLQTAINEKLSFRELDRLYERSTTENKKLSTVARVLHPTADKIFKRYYWSTKHTKNSNYIFSFGYFVDSIIPKELLRNKLHEFALLAEQTNSEEASER